ncbi:MAG: type II secretion system protein [Pseudomonadota bacterium]|nr:type II secretion system protein [Pseudomonadota bacterium]
MVNQQSTPGNQQSGFTLIEMSIVLAIIGLVIGGIVAGQSLVRAAQIRDMIGEFDSYVKAIKEFQDKYHALPGDMNNATIFWANTANGDGNGEIGTSSNTGTPTDTPGGLANSGEWFLAWQHLSDAGFVQGSFTGTYGAGGASEAVIGTNVPASRLSGGGWTLNYYLNTSGNVGLWSDQYGHLLNFGGSVAKNYTIGGILRPDEALSIDQKIDDGMPGTGSIRAWRTSVLPKCTATDTSQTAQIYNIGDSNPDCALVFLLGF